jgi:hypothetical protein
MAKDLLLDAFEQACKAYNAGEYDKLGALLDNDVILKRVDDASSVAGIGNVIAYLNTHQKALKPQIQNIQNVSTTGGNGTQGIVRGTAEHVDNQQNKKTIPIEFIFVFMRDNTNSSWMLINAFAIPRP